MLSAGQINTTAVPRHTTSPKLRVSSVSLKGSSGSRESAREEDFIVDQEFRYQL